MLLQDGNDSLRLECALRELGFVQIGYRVVAHAGIFFVQPIGIPDELKGDLQGFSVHIPYVKDKRRVRLFNTAKKALDFSLGL